MIVKTLSHFSVSLSLVSPIPAGELNHYYFINII